MFFANRSGRDASSGDGVAFNLWDVLKIDGRLARNIDFEVANSKVPNRRKTSILRLQSVKIGENLPRNARFAAANVSRLESLSVPVASPCLWGKLQNLLFACFQL